MRIQCSVCEAAEAAVVCCADEAALCRECDAQIHDANKLASKHQRVPLLKPSKPTRCDICQDKNAYFFCLEDRALLCHGCDMSIHLSNASTSGHRRFLVTGVTASLHTITSSNSTTTAAATSVETSPGTPKLKSSRSVKFKAAEATIPSKHLTRQASAATPKPLAAKARNLTFSTPAVSSQISTSSACGGDVNSAAAGSGKTSILEFLESVPGWKFDDLLDITTSTVAAKPGNSEAAEAHFHMDGSFNWRYSDADAVREEYSRSVPQMTTTAVNAKSNTSGSHSGCSSSSNMGMAGLVTKKLAKKNTNNDVSYMILPDDSSLVPDLGLHSPQELIPPQPRKRRIYRSELDNIFLHQPQQQQQQPQQLF